MNDGFEYRPGLDLAPAPAVRLGGFLLLVLVGLNLRPFLTALGPVLQQVQVDARLDNTTAAALTTLPFLLMGGLALAGPRLSRSFGEQTALLGALMLLVLGAAGRLLIDTGTGLLMTALVAGTGIAAVQALMPGIAKRWFGERVGPAMGLYSAALVGGGALGALVSPAFSELAGDWRPGLAIWALPALIAWLLWLWLAPKTNAETSAPVSLRHFMRLRRAWLLALFFGLANSGYSSLVAWLPSFYQGLGIRAQATGQLLAWMAMFQAAGALLMPLLLRGSRDLRIPLYAVMLLQVAGFAGFALAPLAVPAAWIAVAGFGLGGCFSLCLTLCLDHLQDARKAGSLAAFMQGVGFAITALGPWAVGTLLDRGGDFAIAWWFHAGLAVLLMLSARHFDPAGYARALKTP
ncbi:MAG: cyanate transporter [Oceanospirillaceae bacterium]|nr:cyanate transporter [Oceanospirillaceae bacterium]